MKIIMYQGEVDETDRKEQLLEQYYTKVFRYCLCITICLSRLAK
ncbi:hypothetical protein P9B03_07005 [Metasolibacillus meyeri]|uniref:Uncharacterized protein n=1 Tax=Metasolibacillus meyeri TaxID=1071052 RepID=A0AAW9NQR5_9BACL|nr:hypothetical protein [Metasolibacillus meyeri]MEC1178228.1 hypothetical protein [Metasolibacillus meyeri]